MAKSSAAPSKEILEAALQGLESQREHLDKQIAQVRSLLGGRAPAATGRRAGRPAKKHAAVAAAAATPAAAQSSSQPARKKRALSPEARKRIAAAQKKRWAAFRKGQA